MSGKSTMTAGWRIAGVSAALVVVGGASLAAQSAVAAGESGPQVAAARSAPVQRRANALDVRVRMLARALDLDAGQQAELRAVLLEQRAQVERIWSDPSLPPPYRVSATEALSEHTADRIRALLTEEQRKKYNPPRPPDSALAPARADIEYWMSRAHKSAPQ